MRRHAACLLAALLLAAPPAPAQDVEQATEMTWPEATELFYRERLSPRPARAS